MGHGPSHCTPLEAARMQAMSFDRQPEAVLSDQDRALIQSVLEERKGEYVFGGAHGYRVDVAELAGVVADIVYAAVCGDRRRRDG